jgi:CRP-like cAMP-binding protein
VHFAAGTVIWNAGEPAEFSLGVLSGRIECTNDQGTGEIGSGWVIGWFDSIGEIPRAYTAVAQTDVTALKLEVGHFLEVLEDQFLLSLEILATHASVAVGQLWARDISLTQSD